jgi:hypothetical protein
MYRLEVVKGRGKRAKYREGDVIALIPMSLEELDEVVGPRTSLYQTLEEPPWPDPRPQKVGS